MSARTYRSPLREKRARETRARILEAAAQGFATRGYAGTTLASIASEAGVSVDSVVTVGSKAFLLLECFRRQYAGEGGWRSLLDQPEMQRMLAITDPAEAVDAVVDFLAMGHAKSADLWLVVRATALLEPVVADGLAELCRLKEESFAATGDWLADVGVIERVPASQRDSLALSCNLLMAAETYVTITRDWRYSDEEYRQWLRVKVPQLRP